MSLLRGLFALTLIAGLYTFGPIKIVGFKDYSAEAASAPQQALPAPLDQITQTALPQPPPPTAGHRTRASTRNRNAA